MPSAKIKQFEFYAFFPDNDLSNWTLFKVRIGMGLGYSFNLVGSVRGGEYGAAVFGLNDKFVDVVPNYDFIKAAEKLSVGAFSAIYGDKETFQDWVIEKEDSYWNDKESVDSIILDFMGEHTDSELQPKPMIHST